MSAAAQMAAVCARGAFNTGRLYSAQGQRIWWVQYKDGWLWFSDIDRMISGWIWRDGPTAIIQAPVLPGWLLSQYDNQRYVPFRAGVKPPEKPEDIDFGPKLRI